MSSDEYDAIADQNRAKFLAEMKLGGAQSQSVRSIKTATEYDYASHDIDAIARESAEVIFPHSEWYSSKAEWKIDLDSAQRVIAAAIRRALEPLEQENKGLVKAMALKTKLERHLSEAISERDALVKISEAADQLESLLSRNCGSTDDWPISLKASGDCAQELAGKLTALTRALKPYRKAKNE